MTLNINQAIFLLPIFALFRLLMWAAFRESPTVNAVSWSQQSSKWVHDLKRFDEPSLLSFAECNHLHHNDFNETLDNILKVRVPGTEGHRQVKEYIINSMSDLGWNVEEDYFTTRTPEGRKPFTNIVATLNPKTCRQLVLACHYDSKLSKGNRFLGATDSAVPCAMMIHLARVLHESLIDQKEKSTDLSLQFIFFDGEEAFHSWTQSDSLYGSRHLAELWNRTPPTGGKQCSRNGEAMVSRLDQMDVMVLLDLIGTSNPKFYNFFSETNGIYSRLPGIEQEMNHLKVMEAHPPVTNTEYFDARTSWSHVEDDHIPFMKRGVPIIHLIPSPFPHVWHKDIDNRESLHHPTISNINKIIRVFVSEYLHLDADKLKNSKFVAK